MELYLWETNLFQLFSLYIKFERIVSLRITLTYNLPSLKFLKLFAVKVNNKIMSDIGITRR